MNNQPIFLNDRQENSLIERLDIDNLSFILSYLNGDERVRLSGNIRMNMLMGNNSKALIRLLSKNARVLPRLTIEVVEHGFTELHRQEYLNEVMSNLEIISSMGAVISLDDYGAGHGSAGLLTWDFWHEVKIDGAIVVAAADSSRFNRARIILKSTTDLLHELGLVVVYEHIEDSQMMDMAIGFGADGVQGFHLQRPTIITGMDLSEEFFNGFEHDSLRKTDVSNIFC